jgi:hypothetical protein
VRTQRPLRDAHNVVAAAAFAVLFLFIEGCVPSGPDGDGNDNVPVNDNVVDNENVNDNVVDNENVNDNVEDNENVNDNENGGEVPGLPLSTFSTENFSGSGNCSACHNGVTDESGNDVSNDTAWRPTLMANAAIDPLFLASVAAEVEHAPALAETIEDTCATCHMPMAHTQAVADGSGTAIQDGGLLDPGNALYEAAKEGVSCTLCHQIQPDFVKDPPAAFSGGFVVDTDVSAPDRVLFGPYPEPQFPDLMQNSVGYKPVFGNHLDSAALCATCHNLFTPTLDAAGNIVGEFPEQVPYSEWRVSRFGRGSPPERTCQDCHMPLADGEVNISVIPVALTPRRPYYQHDFLGGNAFMLRLLRDNIEPLELTASTVNFSEAIQRTLEFLRSEAAELAVDEAELVQGSLTVRLRVTNKAGHKFPTSFPSRRAWIHFTVTDGGGAVVFESGAPLPDGSIRGSDADETITAYERHFDLITMASQVQIYEPILGNTDGRVTNVLLRAASYLKDNRLLPEGFDKEAVSEDVAVRGQAALDSNFIGGSDLVSYRINVSRFDGPFTVSAELLYQTLSFKYAQAVLGEEAASIEQFAALYEKADKSPIQIASVEVTLP